MVLYVTKNRGKLLIFGKVGCLWQCVVRMFLQPLSPPSPAIPVGRIRKIHVLRIFLCPVRSYSSSFKSGPDRTADCRVSVARGKPHPRCGQIRSGMMSPEARRAEAADVHRDFGVVSTSLKDVGSSPPHELELHMDRVQQAARIIESCAACRLELYEELSGKR